jgi:uncharacterized membrane protein
MTPSRPRNTADRGEGRRDPQARRRVGDSRIAKAAPDRQRRLTRTIVLGAVAVLAGIAWLARELGMDAAELRGFAVTSVWLVFAMMLLAVVGAVLLRLLRRRSRPGRQSRSARKRPNRGA